MRAMWLVLCAVVLAGSAAAQPAADSRQQAVETGLLGAVVIDGRAETWTLADRMAFWKVPGVSVAVIDDGRIAWAKGYGVARGGTDQAVTPHTRFQAASISKPVAATAALSLVQDGRLSLDGDVNLTLKRWKLPASPFTEGRPVTLKDLLSHTAGLTVHGFPGYAQGAPVPDLAQVLNGAPPANTPAVVSQARPGERWKYSGGGYQVAQAMIEDATGRPLPAVVRERVLRPARMDDSGYEPPADGDFAFGHGADGKPIAGGWHTYPEQAAAGLWTTPGDLARFGLALSAARRGEADGLLRKETALTMMTPVMGNYGLGPGVEGTGDALALSHGGSNEGFMAYWVIHPVTGDGVAVMTNSDAGDGLMMEIVRAVARAYNWPDYAPTAYRTVALGPEVLKGRSGTWITESGGQTVAVTAREEGGRLIFDTFRGVYRFVPVSPTAMVIVENGMVAGFETGPDGQPVMKVFGATWRRKP